MLCFKNYNFGLVHGYYNNDVLNRKFVDDGEFTFQLSVDINNTDKMTFIRSYNSYIVYIGC